MEKSKLSDSVAAIEFNWERVKKKATSKREELIQNNPNVSKRSVPPLNTTPATRTTDTIIDPYHSIEVQAKSLNPNPGKSSPIPTTIDTDMDTVKDKVSDSDSAQLLPRATAQENTTPPPAECDSLLGPEKNAVALITGIKEGVVVGSDLTVDERRLVVSSMKELGQTQDAIAELLKVSRRTIVTDYKALRHTQALAIQATDTMDMAGEVYGVAKTCIRRALQAGSFKTVSVIMKDMVEVLQSLGVVYRAPKTSMQATMHGSLGASRGNGYQKYMDTIGKDKTKVIDVLDCMFSAIDKDQI
jgi:predicted transcriptional regulator